MGDEFNEGVKDYLDSCEMTICQHVIFLSEASPPTFIYLVFKLAYANIMYQHILKCQHYVLAYIGT